MSNRNAARLRQIIREADPDVILAVETDDWWKAQLKDFERTHRFIVHQPQANTYGMLLYSRLELSNVQTKFPVQDDIPSIHALMRLRSGQQIEIHCLADDRLFRFCHDSVRDRLKDGVDFSDWTRDADRQTGMIFLDVADELWQVVLQVSSLREEQGNDPYIAHLIGGERLDRVGQRRPHDLEKRELDACRGQLARDKFPDFL